MNVIPLTIPDVLELRPRRFEDARGFFSETYNRRTFGASGVEVDFIQDNHTRSVLPWTLRGMHFQIAPAAQAKLVRVLRGRVFDVVVDLRAGSPTYGHHASVILSADEWNQIFVPVGFAHAILTMEPNCEVLYKVSSYYSPEHERGLAWNDPALGIDWPLPPDTDPLLIERDRGFPRLAELPRYFP